MHHFTLISVSSLRCPVPQMILHRTSSPFAFSRIFTITLWANQSTSLKCLPTAKMNVIEVERRFSLIPSVKDQLLQTAGSSEIHVTYIHDKYHGENLALADRWLRRRNGEWELKVPINLGQTLGFATYRELSGGYLWKELGIAPLDDNSPVDASLACFAELHTTRTSFILPFQGSRVNVTLDECSSPDGFQCSVGELEILVDTEDQINAATKVIDSLFSHLAVNHLQDNEGKLVQFIRQYRPQLYDKLVEAGTSAV